MARIAGIDLPKSKRGAIGLTYIYGIGRTRSVEILKATEIDESIRVVAIAIIGGLGTILGAFLGAGFLVVMPIALKNVLVDWFQMTAVFAKHVEIMFMGTLIIFFLIVEPHGLARLWQIVKEKLRLWPFPH